MMTYLMVHVVMGLFTMTLLASVHYVQWRKGSGTKRRKVYFGLAVAFAMWPLFLPLMAYGVFLINRSRRAIESLVANANAAAGCKPGDPAFLPK